MLDMALVLVDMRVLLVSGPVALSLRIVLDSCILVKACSLLKVPLFVPTDLLLKPSCLSGANVPLKVYERTVVGIHLCVKSTVA